MTIAFYGGHTKPVVLLFYSPMIITRKYNCSGKMTFLRLAV
jgi:hypothetical protein